MSSDMIARLISEVAGGAILNARTLGSLDAEEACSGRADPRFETEWLRVHEALVSLPLDMETEQGVDRLRETAFKVAYAESKDPELAGEVSDDFELFGRALGRHWDDPWLNGLYVAYHEGRFPYGSVDLVPGRIADLIP